jgi:O-antigen/teichoic acid export membrane protein
MIFVQSKKAKVWEWIKLISFSGSSQFLVQAIGFASGLLVIRFLSTDQYAFYTLANTMLGTLSVLADVGISAGVLTQGGKVWNDRAKLGSVLTTGMILRRKFSCLGILFAVPLQFYFLQKHGASLFITTTIIVSIIFAFLASFTSSILEVAPKLHRDITSLQKITIVSNCIRFFITFLSLLYLPFAFVAVIASALPQVFANTRLKKLSAQYADPLGQENLTVRNDIKKIIQKRLPHNVYFVFSSQLGVWLIAFFGSTTSLAEVGALSRLSMVIGIFTTLFNILIVPCFARFSNDNKILLKRFMQTQIAIILLGFVIVFLTIIFSKQILWILGAGYSELTTALVILAGFCVVELLSFASNSLCLCRDRIMRPEVSIGLSLLFQVCLIPFFNFSTSVGVISYGLANSAFHAVIWSCCFIFFEKIKKSRLSSWIC